MNLRFLLSTMTLSGALLAGAAVISSPSGKIVVTTSIDTQGQPIYTVTLNGKTVIKEAPLGLTTDFTDLSKGLKESEVKTDKIAKEYSQSKIKKSNIKVDATSAKIKYVDSTNKNKLEMEWHVADDGVAYRYRVPRQSERGSMRVMNESSGFVFPEGTTTFLTSQSDPMIGWKRTKPSYEEYYVVDAPMNQKSEYGHGFTFPALFKTPDGIWALITESGVDGYYCGSHLSDFDGKGYKIAFPMEEENNGNGSAEPGVKLPGYTPWRVMAIGETLAPIAETTLPWDLVDPLYEVKKAPRPAKGTWSWILWQDNSINYDDQKTYIDFAAEMGYDNVLIDNWWNTNIGKEKMEQLIAYAHSKGVKPTLWFSSSGHWNDIEQGPVNLMDRPIVRKQWMKWLEDNGVDAIKVDFFGGDKQETMRLYEDIFSDAADHGIDVVVHGCTLPRGWERMYPNFVGAEAVLASENMIFSQDFCDKESLHATLHPFIRNAGAIMEYGGSFMNKRMNRGNDGGNIRRTTDAFQLALSVLFQNPVQYFALAPNNLTDAPEVAMEFLKNVPTTWDDTKLIDGYPGKYVVLARRHGDKWYIGGVSNLDKPLKLELDLSILGKNSNALIIDDGKSAEPVKKDLKMKDPSKVKVTLNPASGFVIVGDADV